MSWIKSNQVKSSGASAKSGDAASNAAPCFYPFKFYPHGVGLQISPIFDTWMDFSRNATDGQWFVSGLQKATVQAATGEINESGICESPRAIANVKEMYDAHPGPYGTDLFVGGVVGDYVGKTCDNPTGRAAAISFDYYYQFYMIKPSGDSDFYFDAVTSTGWASDFQTVLPAGGGYQLRRNKVWMAYGGSGGDSVHLNGLSFERRKVADHIRDPDASPYNLLASSDYVELFPSNELSAPGFNFGGKLGMLAYTAKGYLFSKTANIGYQVMYDHLDGIKMGFFENMPELYLQQIYPTLALVVYGAPVNAFILNQPAWPNFE